MDKKLLLYLILIILSACSGIGVSMPTPSTAELITEEESVYAAVLQDLYPAQTYVIMDTTQTNIEDGSMEETLDYVLPQMDDVDVKTVDSFQVRNDAAYSLRGGMRLGTLYTLFSMDDMRATFGENQNGWDVFYQQHPNAPGIITFSRVGFNAAMTQALVYIGNQSHWLAGVGYYVLLKKVDNQWIIDQQVMTWIS